MAKPRPQPLVRVETVPAPAAATTLTVWAERLVALGRARGTSAGTGEPGGQPSVPEPTRPTPPGGAGT